MAIFLPIFGNGCRKKAVTSRDLPIFTLKTV